MIPTQKYLEIFGPNENRVKSLRATGTCWAWEPIKNILKLLHNIDTENHERSRWGGSVRNKANKIQIVVQLVPNSNINFGIFYPDHRNQKRYLLIEKKKRTWLYRRRRIINSKCGSTQPIPRLCDFVWASPPAVDFAVRSSPGGIHPGPPSRRPQVKLDKLNSSHVRIFEKNTRRFHRTVVTRVNTYLYSVFVFRTTKKTQKLSHRQILRKK